MNGPSMLTLKVMPQGGQFNSQTPNARVLSFTSVPVVNSAPSLVVPVMTSQSPLAKRPLAVAAKPPAPAPVVTTIKEASNKAASNGTMSASAVTPSPVAPPSPPSITALLGLGSEELSLGADSTTLLDVPLANNPPNFVGEYYICIILYSMSCRQFAAISHVFM